MKNIVFIGGILSEEQEKNIFESSLGSIDSAANVFQKNILSGLNIYNMKIISVPFIGSFPNKSKILNFKIKGEKSNVEYINFCNLWGIRNISRYLNLRKYINNNKELFIKSDMVIIYSMHTPFLKNLSIIKSINPKIKIISIVPDLPEFMNLNYKISLFYKFLKKIDIKVINKMQCFVDGYVLLTKYMYGKINNNNRPYVVIEGIANEKNIPINIQKKENTILMYAGTLNKKYGILGLLKAFSFITEDNVQLLIFGDGDAKEDVLIASNNDNRIRYMGCVSHRDVMNEMERVDILINPRKNEEFTKYSFPSKILEYLTTGKPVVSYKLDCFGSEYNEVLNFPEKEDEISLYKAIDKIIKSDKKELEKLRLKQFDFIRNKNSINQCSKIFKLLDKMK